MGSCGTISIQRNMQYHSKLTIKLLPSIGCPSIGGSCGDDCECHAACHGDRAITVIVERVAVRIVDIVLAYEGNPVCLQHREHQQSNVVVRRRPCQFTHTNQRDLNHDDKDGENNLSHQFSCIQLHIPRLVIAIAVNPAVMTSWVRRIM